MEMIQISQDKLVHKITESAINRSHFIAQAVFPGKGRNTGPGKLIKL